MKIGRRRTVCWGDAQRLLLGVWARREAMLSGESPPACGNADSKRGRADAPVRYLLSSTP